MSVNTPGEDNQQTQMGAAMSSAFSQQARTGNSDRRGQDQGGERRQSDKNTGPSFNFRNMGTMSRSAMGRTPASEALTKLVNALHEAYKSANESFEIRVLPIDMNTDTRLNVSIAIIATRDKQAPNLGVAFHTLIAAASIEPPAPRFETINGVNTEITRVTGEAYDDTMREVIRETMARTYGTQIALFDADAEVVPREFNVNDPQAVYGLAANAVFATTQELETHRADFVDLNLAHAEKDSNLNVRVTYGNSQSYDPVGQPIRTDIKIDFSAAAANQNQQQVERTSTISQVGGFLDLVWDPAQPQQGAGWGPQVQSYQRYTPRFVMTALESTQLLTIPAQLLALIPALSLRENNQWMAAFRHTNGFTTDGLDMHDIGGVGIEANLENNPSGVGSRIDTKSDSFKPEHLHKLVAATFKPGLILSLDVPECGSSTWYNGVFAAAAAGNRRAMQAIYDAANTLTDGKFAEFFTGDQIAIDEDNRIHLGHYADRQGIRRDIRDIDYLAVINLVGEKDPQVIRDWSDSFLKTNYDLRLRLAGRKRIITNLVTDVQITGYARRVTFAPAFTDALAKAVAACGLSIRANVPYADLGSFERATGAFVGASTMGAEATGVFNRGFGGQTTWGGNRGFGSNRW